MSKNEFVNGLSRRDFMKTAGIAAAACAMCRGAIAATAGNDELHEARFYEKLKNGSVRCGLCPWECVVWDGKRGKCGVRENRGGTYYSLVYGRPCVANNDPIEKKPLFHVYPGSRAYSIATVGCNFECKFCQNWDISQKRPEQAPVPYVSPDALAKAAAESSPKCKCVAYTYSEPTIFTEYMIDCAKAAKDRGLGNVVVSNGFISDEPGKELCALVTAIKIDFKGFTDKFYQETCAGQLRPVLDTLKRLAAAGVWFEMVNLLVPTLNDNMDDIKRMSEWIVKQVGPNVPLHFTRFHPDYKLKDLPPTPVETLTRARQIAMDQGCNFVYTGNAPGEGGENTYCPKCKAVMIDRYGFGATIKDMEKGKCGKCGTVIPGVWAL
jgi:pyruvate formate lyase activating enzyme